MIKSLALLILILSTYAANAQSQDQEAVLYPVNTQLEGYNNRDIDLFMEAYADTVKVYSFPGHFLYQGADTMRQQYQQMFANLPDLNAEITNRMVQGNVVIDQERVTIRKDQAKINAIAIYKIKDGKIYEVHFISN